MSDLEEICKWNVKIPRDGWAKFKIGINDIARAHCRIQAPGRCVGNGFELYAGAEEGSDYVSMVLSIMANHVAPFLLIRELRRYIIDNIDELIEYQENYKRPS